MTLRITGNNYLKKLLCILMLCIVYSCAIAQNYYNIGHTSGVQVLGNISVRADRINAAGVYPGTNCGLGPYHIGAGSVSSVTRSGYQYSFDRAVKEVRFTMNASEPGEEITIVLNGKNYTLTSGNLSTYTGMCGSTGGAAISAGKLIFTGGSNNNSILRIIDSIRTISILDIDTVGGTVMTTDFVTDTAVDIVNYVDTLLCVGDTIHINYRIAGSFSPSNQFVFQLSDQYGNFGIPTVLATVSGTNSGSCDAVIPVVPSSGAYKIRAVSTSPTYVSLPFPHEIAIGNMPLASIYNTGPACEGGYAQIGYTNFSHFTEVRWSRWGGVVFSKLQHHGFPVVKQSDSGLYVGEMQDYGCLIMDTTRLKVKPNPLVAAVYDNSPVCAGDTLHLHGNIDTPGVLNVWIKPDGNTDSVKNLSVSNANIKDAGRYVLVTRLDGCVAFDTSYVDVKYSPQTNLDDISICFGDALRLKVTDTAKNVVYAWTGPSGYYATTKDTIITPAYFKFNGVYTLSASLNGCVSYDTMTAEIKPLPTKPIALKDTSMCSGGSLWLAGREQLPGISYSWKGPAGFTSSTADTVLQGVAASATGSYVLTAMLNGCATADTIDVLIRQAPQHPQIEAGSPVAKGATISFVLKNKEGGVNYTWTGPANFYSPLISPEIKNAEVWHSGIYTLLAELNNCADSAKIEVKVGDVADTGFIIVYPNANDGDFFIKGILGSNKPIQMRITNAAGQMVYEAELPVTGFQLFEHIRLKGRLASGVYMLKLNVEGQFRQIKLVVNRG